MPKLLRLSGLAFGLLAFALSAAAQEDHRISLSVVKRTVGQPTAKTAAGDERGRVQALFITVQNGSSHGVPEGVLRWTAVVRKTYGDSYKYSGTEPLKALRSFQSVEIQCGSFEIDSHVGAASIERDRIDYEVVVLHEGKETASTVSTTTFAALAGKAQPMTAMAEAPDAKPAKRPAEAPAKDAKPGMPAAVGAEKMPAQNPAPPVAEPPPVPQQKFDFFNLGGKTAPKAN
jgi:hypothetical protein